MNKKMTPRELNKIMKKFDYNAMICIGIGLDNNNKQCE